MLLNKIPLSLYIHLPWCETQCPYCDFSITTDSVNGNDTKLAEAIIKDINQSNDLIADRKFKTIYFGGGTPSLASTESILLGGVPVIYICFVFSFAINWMVFLPSFMMRTERYFDLIGSITFISIALFAIYSKISLRPDLLDHRSSVLALLIIVWAFRLGSFLFVRVIREGHDKRFSETKKSF